MGVRWRAAVHGVAESQTQHSDRTTRASAPEKGRHCSQKRRTFRTRVLIQRGQVFSSHSLHTESHPRRLFPTSYVPPHCPPMSVQEGHVLDLRTVSHTSRHPLQELQQSSGNNAGIIMALLQADGLREMKSTAPGYTVKGKSLDSNPRPQATICFSQRARQFVRKRILFLQRPQEGSSFTAATG